MSNVISFTTKQRKTQDGTAGVGEQLILPPVLHGMRELQAQASRELVLAAYALEISALRLQAASECVPAELEKRIEDGLLEIGRLLQAVRDKLPELRLG